MKILLAYYSRTGNTERLALHLRDRLQSAGHEVSVERIEVIASRNKWRLVLPLLSTIPVLCFFLSIAPFRRWWLRHYPQAQQDIKPPVHRDVSGFDCICIGGPKWLYIAYPVARYLQSVSGLAGKPVAAFATFCGPPLQIFELDMLFIPLKHRIERAHARFAAAVAISSHYHEFFFFNEMEYVFRLISRLRFKRSLREFGLHSEWGRNEVERFCAELETAAARETTDKRATLCAR